VIRAGGHRRCAAENGHGRDAARVAPITQLAESIGTPAEHNVAPPTAQLCALPSASWLALETPATATGTLRDAVVPSPSCPAPFAPQQRTLPSAIAAQVCELPAAIATAVPGRLTFTGAVR
jgi:hypothetical protein